MQRLLLCLAALCCAHLLPAQSPTYLHCGTVIDGRGGEPKQEQTITVLDGRITDVRDGYTDAPAGAEVIDLKQRTVLPGLIDLHVHVESQSSKNTYLERFTMEPADVALRATTYMDKTLAAGFTTVRDLGGTGVNVSLRNAINAGYIPGPRIITAEKAIASTGGHGDPSNGRNAALRFVTGPTAGVVNSTDEAYQAVRQRYQNGADCIKITATGGVLSVAKDGQGPQFRVEEIEAIVAAANDYGYHVAAHAHGAEGMKRAVLGGVTTIEHGTYMTPEIMELMKERGTYYVPTLLAGDFVARKAQEPNFYPAIIVPKALTIGRALQQTFADAYAAGVPIAFGTDTGVSYHGENAKEFALLVKGGMSPMEAIQAATTTAAKVLDMEGEIGQLTVGARADIIAVDGNPTADVTVLEAVKFVMKDGEVYLE